MRNSAEKRGENLTIYWSQKDVPWEYNGTKALADLPAESDINKTAVLLLRNYVSL